MKSTSTPPANLSTDIHPDTQLQIGAIQVIKASLRYVNEQRFRLRLDVSEYTQGQPFFLFNRCHSLKRWPEANLRLTLGAFFSMRLLNLFCPRDLCHQRKKM